MPSDSAGSEGSDQTVQKYRPQLFTYERLLGIGVVGNRGVRSFISGEQGNKNLKKNEGNRGTKTILGNME